MSWYTKRMSLGAVYKATEIYMLQDETDDFEQTWEFLDNRLKDMATFGKSFGQVCLMKWPSDIMCINTEFECLNSYHLPRVL